MVFRALLLMFALLGAAAAPCAGCTLEYLKNASSLHVRYYNAKTGYMTGLPPSQNYHHVDLPLTTQPPQQITAANLEQADGVILKWTRGESEHAALLCAGTYQAPDGQEYSGILAISLNNPRNVFCLEKSFQAHACWDVSILEQDGKISFHCDNSSYRLDD